jgi:transaldolase
VLKNVAALGIDLDAVTDELEADGVKKFAQSFHSLLDVIQHKVADLLPARASGGTRKG